jgi:hypothetical protein
MASKRNRIETPAQTAPTIPPIKGIELLKRQIEAGQILLQSNYLDSNSFAAWKNTTKNFMVKAFGDNTQNVNDFDNAGRISSVPFGADGQWWNQRNKASLEAKLARLASYIELLQIEFELQPTTQDQSPKASPPQSMSTSVFVVHGHDKGSAWRVRAISGEITLRANYSS